ncbi:unnamed protein product, partial [Polarella glacialis]
MSTWRGGAAGRNPPPPPPAPGRPKHAPGQRPTWEPANYGRGPSAAPPPAPQQYVKRAWSAPSSSAESLKRPRVLATASAGSQAAQAAAAAVRAGISRGAGARAAARTAQSHIKFDDWGVEVVADEEVEAVEAEANNSWNEAAGEVWAEEEEWQEESWSAAASSNNNNNYNNNNNSNKNNNNNSWQNARPPPGAPPSQGSRGGAPPATRKAAKLPEELGFDVSRGVRTKGWQIGEMEDGVRPTDDGEPDVFFSHSFTDNCRRVDMALFECNCPNSLTCCSHAYAAVVALPHYRHRAALLWALRQDLGSAAGDELGGGGGGRLTPAGGFEAARGRLKKVMLRHLPLDDIADAAIDTALGLWARVDWLRRSKGPKLNKYWAENVEKVLGGPTSKPSSETAGEAAQQRLRALLTKLRMAPTELGPLLLALAEGDCDTVQEAALESSPAAAAWQKQRWEQLSAKVWGHVAGGTEDLGVESFPELRVARGGGTEDKPLFYRSFAELLADWEDPPAELRLSLGGEETANKGASTGGELVEREAEEALGALLNEHFGRVGEAVDWASAAASALGAPPATEDFGRVLGAGSVAGGLGASGQLVAKLAEEGWEQAASRLVGALPLFRRCAAAGGAAILAIFELPGGEFLKLDAAAGTGEAWEAALQAHDTRRAAEAMLALIHSCGSIRATHLQETLGASYQRAAEDSPESFALLAGALLKHLPRHFAQHPAVARFILEPLAKGGELAFKAFSRASGARLAERVALATTSGAAVALARQAAKRLSTAQSQADAEEEDTGSEVLFATHQRAAVQLRTKGAAAAVVEVFTAEVLALSSPTPAAVGPSALESLELSRPSADGNITDPAEALVEAIRREEFGFHGESLAGGALQAKQNARLARALKRLAGELYGSDVHWQLELLQNADDNSYKEGVEPTAEFLLCAAGGKPAALGAALRESAVVFRCNEAGFREADIRAICDIGNSSKVGSAKYGAGGRVVATGEKGLGFKAVFSLTDRPRLFSGPFRLEFDAGHASGIGYVLPRWLGGAADAALRLPLRPELEARRQELFGRLADLPPSLLLFLKQLREVSVAVMDTNGAGSRSDEAGIRIRRAAGLADGPGRWEEATSHEVLEVSRDGGVTWERERWLLLRRRFEVPQGICKPGISTAPATTLLELALPLDPDGAFDRSRVPQQVFAFLP